MLMPILRQLFVSKTLVWLLVLCLCDAIFTDIGLHLAFIEELNPLIRTIYEWHVVGYYVVKLILPVSLMFLYPHIQKKGWVQPCLSLTVLIYGAVNVYHFIWLTYGLHYLATN
ncbi:hypothetical protein GCM10008018_67060 [Paenibacillus marchantiophytorum]|uniref:DUF5658 domain-containing protein n=1 Tax=Paenibacillus marchantiophytorum TaxID=1619310 RepID=A0ABQ1FIQ9_9BACL|nr:DUF5658 family protein [Paenibacillus marchantiophytorum]GGA12620.1 hypothetical protein GCM10008018_67060 [Paenibacillus marchantiophytorum]